MALKKTHDQYDGRLRGGKRNGCDLLALTYISPDSKGVELSFEANLLRLYDQALKLECLPDFTHLGLMGGLDLANGT